MLVRDDHLLISEDSNSDCFTRWKFGLIGRFSSGSQSLPVIKSALSYYWGRQRRFEILQANENAWLILLETEADLLWAMHNGPCPIRI